MFCGGVVVEVQGEGASLFLCAQASGVGVVEDIGEGAGDHRDYVGNKIKTIEL
jgi:hypothetical protein